jgi:hypothetical protein
MLGSPFAFLREAATIMAANLAANYDNLTHKKADELIKSSFNFLEYRLSLNKKYYKKFAEALTPVAVAKYM